MTLQELQQLVATVQNLVINLDGAISNLRTFVNKVSSQVNDPDFSQVLFDGNVDDFVAVQTPIYIGLLTAIETATDALGTDGLK